MPVFGRNIKLRIGSVSIQPAWIPNNNDLEHAELINDMGFDFEYKQPMFERVLRFDQGSFQRLSEDKDYFEEKVDVIKAFKEKHRDKFVKVHAQLPAAYHVAPKDVIKWMELQQSADLRLIEILDVTHKSTTKAKETSNFCLENLKKGQKPILGVNLGNPSSRDILLRIEFAKKHNIDYVICYGVARPTSQQLAVSEALQGTRIFAQYAGLNRVTTIGERQLVVAHVAQALGFNATSLRTIKAKPKKKIGKKGGRAIPPASYDPFQWEHISLKERLKKYGEEWPTDIVHPIIEEKTTTEIYKLSKKLRNATLRTFEASAADYEMRKTEATIAKDGYAEMIKEKPRLLTVINALTKEYQAQRKLKQF